jgi:hypothetical protein
MVSIEWLVTRAIIIAWLVIVIGGWWSAWFTQPFIINMARKHNRQLLTIIIHTFTINNLFINSIFYQQLS